MVRPSVFSLCLVAAMNALPDLLFKDVVIVGGGASGSYAAVRLREDFGKSITLVEKDEILGGHVDSYVDTKTGTPYDFGVEAFIQAGNATGFFDRLGVRRGRRINIPVNTTYIDFKSGKMLDFAPPPVATQLDALADFLRVVEPSHIPGDLLVPFGDFVSKHGLDNAMPLIYQTTGLGLGNITNAITLFALQAFGASMARSALGLQGAFVPASGRNQDLYDAVATVLGSDVLYASTVVSTLRTKLGVIVTVKHLKSGRLTYIAARALLIAIEPTEDNTGPFSLDPEEKRTLSKFTYTREYTGIIDNTALAANTSYFSLPSNAAPNNYLSYPGPPFTARIDCMGSGHYFRVTVIGDDKLDDQGAKALVERDFKTLLNAHVLRGSRPEKVHWVAFSTHGPMHARVSVDHVQRGFFQKLYTLQGRRSTWWTGGAWSVNFQSTLWQYDDIIMPMMLQS
ncbi:FAD dependent oxidoreductase, putative [Metarhizium acridum CQMa 102]|uniref:FAD dependent oxidoreductase, putative n=1 Tax=Metarhizium acridum (strain CQMa 102) TaxID=655827 RepID=E9EDQ9_METAQ|nr:FAD dependent oxidoreductase, putative [Metarhizium acridum CQMa 102]EFY85924.1 FAD dependent oxidoreductase, putative [Metarhizium acridum CQMa 102]